MIPLYGFLQGDTIGLLVLVEESETLTSIRDRLKESGSLRVAIKDGGDVVVNSQKFPLTLSVRSAGLAPLDRFDVRWE